MGQPLTTTEARLSRRAIKLGVGRLMTGVPNLTVEALFHLRGLAEPANTLGENVTSHLAELLLAFPANEVGGPEHTGDGLSQNVIAILFHSSPSGP
jgi:hypothetical protein